MPSQPAPSVAPPPLLSRSSWLDLSVVAGGGLGAGLVFALFYALPGNLRLAFVGGIAFGLVLVLTGNPRLTLLWGLIGTAPLDLGKRFMSEPHMGGEAAFRIDIPDVFLALLTLFLLRDFIRRDRRDFRWPWPVWCWLGITAIGLVGFFFGNHPLSAAHEMVRMLKFLLLFLVIVHELARLRQFEQAVAAMMVAVCVQSVLAIAQYILDRPLGLAALGEATAESFKLLSEATLEGGAPVFRVSALLGHANLFSAFIATQAPFALAILFTRAPWWLRAISIVGLALCVPALVLTLSRTGWIMMGAAMGGVLLLSFFHPVTRRRFVFGRVAVVVVGALFVVAFSGPIMTRLLKSDKGAVDVRYEWIYVAGRMLAANPVFGTGLNSFVYEMPPYTKYGSVEGVRQKYGENFPVVHNVYAIYAAETGAVGLVLFLAMNGGFVAISLSNLRARHELAFALGMAGVCSIGAFLLDWLASFSMRNTNMGRMYFLLMGVNTALYYWRKYNEPAALPAGPAAPEVPRLPAPAPSSAVP